MKGPVPLFLNRRLQRGHRTIKHEQAKDARIIVMGIKHGVGSSQVILTRYCEYDPDVRQIYRRWHFARAKILRHFESVGLAA